jgi:hypothetical protein
VIVATYLVTVTLPPGMTPEQGRCEVRGSICFGSPQVQFLHLTEEPDRDDEHPGSG